MRKSIYTGIAISIILMMIMILNIGTVSATKTTTDTLMMATHERRAITATNTTTPEGSITLSNGLIGNTALINMIIVFVLIVFFCCCLNVIVRPLISGELFDRQFFVVRDEGSGTKLYAYFLMFLGGLDILGAGTLLVNSIFILMERKYTTSMPTQTFWIYVMQANGIGIGAITGISSILAGLFIKDSDEPITILFSGFVLIAGNCIALVLMSLLPLLLLNDVTNFYNMVFLFVGMAPFAIIAVLTFCASCIWFFIIFDVKESINENFIEAPL